MSPHDAHDALPPADPGSLADTVAEAALAVPGVTELHPGLFGEVATYFPGRRVAGVALRDEDGEVHIVADVTSDLQAVAAQVRDIAEKLTGLQIAVTVEDITMGPTSVTNGVTTNE
ncbi:Asp23/Gls24 family envelope stress response protein [Gordonia zhaorongruii]|uniref:Asp23/Gls24 family envelope stress response protein n=1 Tax=Gordonia zhaorongruii TaxID=2597659 RepID=UPI001044992B|nr:Asp23/Gls24 family envelope stress response protein [Gordonia zhaorongruii]